MPCIQVDEPIILGGNNFEHRVESDEMRKGRKKKGIHGHSSQYICDAWGAFGHDINGKKKLVLEP